MTESLQRWIDENKMMVSEERIDDLDIIVLDRVGKFLLLEKNEDGKIIDGDFSFILSDEEFDLLDEHKVDYILFEFGGKFYYSGLKLGKNKYNEVIYIPEFNDFKYLGRCSEEFIMDFAHLGVHDEYEMLSGSGSCELWCKKAKFLGHKYIGVCNKNSLASSLSMQTYAEKYGLKCILGETITTAVNYDKTKDIQETFDLKLYVMNTAGWQNLLIISKIVNVDFEGKFIPLEMIYKHTTGLCCVIPKDSHFNYLVKRGKRKSAKEVLLELKKHFKKIYYQIDTVEYESRQLFKEHLSSIDNYILYFKSKIKPILINDSYYLDKEEHELKGMLHKISGRAAPEAKDQYFKSVRDTLDAYSEWIYDVDALFETIVEGISNAYEFAESCNFRIDNSERKIPQFEVEDPEGLFFDLLQKGIDERIVGKVDDIDKYLDRIQTECELIVPNDLCSYFLILWDIINWSNENDIMVGPGRGSVCGSLVAYCLGITAVDPIKYNLYFERFLNVSRVSAHHSYHLTLEDGREVSFSDGDKIPLVGGKVIEAKKDLDFNKLDIDIDSL